MITCGKHLCMAPCRAAGYDPVNEAWAEVQCSIRYRGLTGPHVWSCLLTSDSFAVVRCASGPVLVILQRRQTMQSPDDISGGCA